MNIGNLLLGGVIAVGAGPPLLKLFKLFSLAFCLLWIADCSGRIVGYPLFLNAEEKLVEKKISEEKRAVFDRKWEQDRILKLKSKMNTGDLKSQTILAMEYLNNDNSTDDTQAMKWLVDAAEKGCADAQCSLGEIYWRKENKSKAREQWILAAQKREKRKYGTGSYKARENIWWNFRADYNLEWGKTPWED